MIRGVPYDAEVEYLESAGAQYIDTGVYPSASTVWRMRCAPAASSCVMGCMNATARRFQVTQLYGGYVARAYVGVGSSSYPSFVELGGVSLNQFHDYEIDAAEGMVAMDGVSHPYPYNHAALPAAVSVWLFGSNSDSDSYKRLVSAKIACAMFIQDGVVVRDFTPVRVGQVGYMYDRVSRKLFGAQGTGSFGIGPDAAVPVMGLHRYATAVGRL